VTLVKDIMSPGSVTLPPTSTAAEAAKLMASKNIGSVLVVEGGKLVGIITERDIVKLVVKGELDKPLAEVATKNPVTLSPSDPVIVAAGKMVEHNIRHLPVVDEKGFPLGVVSIRDILKHII